MSYKNERDSWRESYERMKMEFSFGMGITLFLLSSQKKREGKRTTTEGHKSRREVRLFVLPIDTLLTWEKERFKGRMWAWSPMENREASDYPS